MTTTRIGLAGYGFGGRFFHAPLLAAAPGVQFAGVVTRSPERRAELAHDHSATPAFDSLADLAAAGADAVAISTPAPTHIPLALRSRRLQSQLPASVLSGLTCFEPKEVPAQPIHRSAHGTSLPPSPTAAHVPMHSSGRGWLNS